jgi:hypothetical protein
MAAGFVALRYNHVDSRGRQFARLLHIAAQRHHHRALGMRRIDDAGRIAEP